MQSLQRTEGRGGYPAGVQALIWVGALDTAAIDSIAATPRTSSQGAGSVFPRVPCVPPPSSDCQDNQEQFGGSTGSFVGSPTPNPGVQLGNDPLLRVHWLSLLPLGCGIVGNVVFTAAQPRLSVLHNWRLEFVGPRLPDQC